MKTTDILMAKIGAAHGIKGEVRVKSFTDDPEGFGDYGPLHDAKGNTYKVSSARFAKGMVITRFKSVDTREKAEALNGVELFVDRSVLPEVEDEDEFYMSDLIGLDVETQAGEAFGTIKEVYDFGAGDIVEIKRVGGALEMFSFTKAAFPTIDIEGRKVVIIPPVEVSEREEYPPSQAGQAEIEQ